MKRHIQADSSDDKTRNHAGISHKKIVFGRDNSIADEQNLIIAKEDCGVILP